MGFSNWFLQGRISHAEESAWEAQRDAREHGRAVTDLERQVERLTATAEI